MYNTNRILIVVLILLVLAIGLAGGYIIQSNSMNNNSSTVNQTNQSINNTNTITTESTSGGESSTNNYETGEITEDEAINIALSAVGPINQKYYVKTEYSVGSPHKWRVMFIDSKTNQLIVGVSINAATGEVRKIFT